MVLEAIASLRERWAGRREYGHPHAVGAEPAADGGPRRRVAGHLPVLVRADDRRHVRRRPRPTRRLGLGVRGRSRTGSSRECAARDDWLAEHPPTFEWWPNGVMPMEIPESDADRGGDAGAPAPTSAAPRARRPGLLVRRRHLTHAGRDPLDRLRAPGLRPRRATRRSHDRRVRPGRRAGRAPRRWRWRRCASAGWPRAPGAGRLAVDVGRVSAHGNAGSRRAERRSGRSAVCTDVWTLLPAIEADLHGPRVALRNAVPPASYPSTRWASSTPFCRCRPGSPAGSRGWPRCPG